MASMFTKVSSVMLLVVVLTSLRTPKIEALTCGEVVSAVALCLGYLRNGGVPPSACCNGLKELRNKATTTRDRRDICNCLKGASSSYLGVSGSYAASLPGKCGVNVPYKISSATDCNKIQ